MAAAFAVTLGMAFVDLTTPNQLNVAIAYSLPLLLAGGTRSRWLLWTLTALLAVVTFVAYAQGIGFSAFTATDPFFVNRILDVASLLVVAVLLQIAMVMADTREAQARMIHEQNERLQAVKASRRVIEVLEIERRRLAGRLHDIVGQNLTALSLNLNVMKAQLAPLAMAHTGMRLEDSLTLTEETIGSIRDVMTELRPPLLDEYGLASSLRWYAELFSKRTGIVATVIGRDLTPRLSPEARMAFFHIAQEALANTAKHARAQNVTMTLGNTSEEIWLNVADDGCGFDPIALQRPVAGHGWGLMIMRERAAAMAARLSVESEPGRGTRVVVTMNRAA
ncbi:MAG: sensor histidine kinase [Casimicrobiaceae bacterium]